MGKSKSSWKWNYFTLESISKVKCSLCGSVRKPALKTSKPLLDHLKDKMTDDAHRAPSENASNMFMKREFSWDSHYETLFSDNMFKPYVKCKYCPDFIPMSSDNTSFLTTPPDLGEHLQTYHNIIYTNWEALENWIYGRTEGCDSPGILKDQLIKVDRCEVCDVEIGAKNAIMLVKHLIEKHRNDPKLNFRWDLIPKEIRPSDVTVREDTTLSSDIADRPGPSRQGSSAQGVYSESPQFSSKRKKEVLEISEPAVSTQIKEPPYKRRKSSPTDDSE
ncbi:BED-type domain-containing protein [Camponotus japonicus]